MHYSENNPRLAVQKAMGGPIPYQVLKIMYSQMCAYKHTEYMNG